MADSHHILDGSESLKDDAIIGELVYKAGISEDKGLRLCNGQALNRTTYSLLFAEIGTTYGVGDGSTTFNVPNMVGRVPGCAGQATFTSTFAASAVNTTSNVITVDSNESLYTGAAVVLSTSSAAPAGLTAGNTYYIIRGSSTSVSLATTRANAVSGTAIDITSQGTGNHTLTLTYANRAVGSLVGEEDHSLVVAEMPSHTHTVEAVQVASQNAWAGGDVRANSTIRTTSATGGSGAHNVMQPTAFVGYWFIYSGVV